MPNRPTPARLVRPILPFLLVLIAVAMLVGTWSWVRVPDPVDWDDPAGWLAHTAPDAALLAAGRIVVIAIAGWLLLTTLLALAARACLATARAPRMLVVLAAGVHRCTPAVVRHAVGGAVVVSLVAGASTRSPAGAGPGDSARPAIVALGDRPVVVPLGPVRDGRVTRDPGVSTTVTTGHPGAPSPPPSPPTPTPAGVPAPVPTAASTPAAPTTTADGDRRVVRPGDSLWTIARDHLRNLGLATDDASVGRYWRALCDANRAGLTSGDVDLVFPGEPIDLPPVV